MTVLLANEHLDGTPAERHRLHALLRGLRTGAAPAPLPGITFQTLTHLLAARPATVDLDLFRTGYELLSTRYAEIGIRALLPPQRVWVGVRSTAAAGSAQSFGGFHHPGQGYRHLQMNAAITLFGNLSGHTTPPTPQAVALDLLRAYAHDCLHFGTYRRYRLGPRGEPARVQYGINFRRLDGTTYSLPDPPDARRTRNLGIVMEGATDIEATTIARHTADLHGLTEPPGSTHLTKYAFADVTGRLSTDDISTARRTANPYLRSLSGFARSVTSRYRALLDDLTETPHELHHLLITAMISGDLGDLNAWLDARHGPGSFARRFRAPIFSDLDMRPTA
ncbi:hypothetical protein [Nonomuraea sp. NPDC048901]|uniref:hypothetical protein n=1 Tax=Nonomuraea sp. NPDC048901 TaxID=3155627 RepID=UPI0033C87A20